MSRKRQIADPPDDSQPVVEAPPASWFLGPDDEVTLKVSGGEIVILPELTAGENAALFDGWDTSNVAAALDEYRVRVVAAYALAWTWERAWKGQQPLNPDDREKHFAAVASAPSRIIERIYDAIQEHEKKRPALPDLPKIDIHPDEAVFLGPQDDVPLNLPFGQSVTVKGDLEAGERAKLLYGLPVSAAGTVNKTRAGIKRIAAYVKGWTLTYPNGQPVPATADALHEMRMSRFDLLRRQIEAYEAALEALEENPTGADGSTRTSASVNA